MKQTCSPCAGVDTQSHTRHPTAANIRRLQKQKKSTSNKPGFPYEVLFIVEELQIVCALLH